MNPGILALAVLNAFVAKPLVMALAGYLVLVLWRRGFGESASSGRTGYRLLALGMACFCASELVCAAEVYGLGRPSDILSCAHSIFSGLAAGLLAWGAFRLLDARVLHVLDDARPCLWLPACGSCAGRADRACRIRPLLLGAALFLALSAAVPLAAPTATIHTCRADDRLPMDSLNCAFDRAWQRARGAVPEVAPFHIPSRALFLEFRVFPLLAAGLALAAFLALALGRERSGVLLLAAAAGLAAYVYGDLLAYAVKRDAYFGGLVHEVTELALLSGGAFVLRLSAPARPGP